MISLVCMLGGILFGYVCGVSQGHHELKQELKEHKKRTA